MLLKLLSVGFLLVTLAAAQYPAPWEDEDSFGKIDYVDRCNETYCSPPCEGAAPPPVCPTKMPMCPTKCACIMDCSTDTLTCFMTKHCLEIRRFFTKRPTKPMVTE